MKLRELFTNGEHIPERSLDHGVSTCKPMDTDVVATDTLRYWNGVDAWPAYSLKGGGVMVVPRDKWTGTADPKPDVVVLADDAKASFFEAVRMLHGNEPQMLDHHGSNWIICHAQLELGSTWGFGNVIGGEGFGFHKGQRVPHIGGVRIGADVEIGSLTCIDRGTLGDTVIGDRTKIDNRVHIAHNVRIGTDCQIVAGAVIGGSAVLGDRVFVGINASIKNKVRIGNDVTIGMGAVVLRDVPDGATVVGNPARIIKQK